MKNNILFLFTIIIIFRYICDFSLRKLFVYSNYNFKVSDKTYFSYLDTYCSIHEMVIIFYGPLHVSDKHKFSNFYSWDVTYIII